MTHESEPVCIDLPVMDIPDECNEVIEFIKKTVKTRRQMMLLRAWLQFCESQW